jgi:hypothetical protein
MTVVLGGVPVCKRCQELIVKRLVKESDYKKANSGDGRRLLLRLAGALLGFCIAYVVTYYSMFKTIPTFGLFTVETEAAPAVWVGDPRIKWPKLVVQVEADMEGSKGIVGRNAAFVRARNGKVFLITSNALPGETGENTGFVLTQSMGGNPGRWRLNGTDIDLGARNLRMAERGTLWMIEVDQKRVPTDVAILECKRSRLSESEPVRIVFHALDRVPAAITGQNAIVDREKLTPKHDDNLLDFAFEQGQSRFPVGAPVLDARGNLAGVVSFAASQGYYIERLDSLASLLGLSAKDGKLPPPSAK